jgi:hypothetical protein
VTSQHASELEQAIQALGEYGHVRVRAERGHLVIAPDGEPVARLTPLGVSRFGLSFHNHSGRWEPMPFVGDIQEQARNVTTALGAYLERMELSGRNSGSDH